MQQKIFLNIWREGEIFKRLFLAPNTAFSKKKPFFTSKCFFYSAHANVTSTLPSDIAWHAVNVKNNFRGKFAVKYLLHFIFSLKYMDFKLCREKKIKKKFSIISTLQWLTISIKERGFEGHILNIYNKVRF